MVTIKECGEPLVDIKRVCPGVVIALNPGRLKQEKTAFVRQTVAEMLKTAQSYLPSGTTFIIRDAWRPQHVQKEILQEFTRRFEKQHPNWSAERIAQEVGKYAAPAEGPEVSGHLTGGAIDVRLIHKGRRLPMRSKKLSYQENAKTEQPKLPKPLQRNRQVMYDALTKAGFSNYPEEFWHWSYGDIWWAKRNHKPHALYGIITKVESGED
jgi:D-alanyl-D-alanine dipeptidase